MKFRILFLFLLILSCKQKTTTTDSILDYLPKDAAVILKINNLSSFKSELKNSEFFSKTNKTNLFKKIAKKVDGINFLNPTATCAVGFYELGKENFEFLYVSDNNPNFFNIEKARDKVIETLTYENREVKKYILEDNILFVFELDDKIVASSSQMLLENFIRIGKNKKVPNKLRKLYDTADNSKSASIIVNLKKGGGLLSSTLKNNNSKTVDAFADWISIDFNTDSNKTSFNGIAIANDSIKNFINLFKGTVPVAEGVSNVSPKNADAILSFSFNNYETFANNQKKYLDRAQKIDTLFNTIEEVGIIYLNKEKAIVLNSFGAANLTEAINQFSIGSSSYQGIEIFALNNKDFISSAFNPLIKDFESNFYILLEDTFIFATKKETLQSIIANSKSGTTFNKTEVYNSAKSSLANESSLLFISNQKGIQNFLELDFSSDLFIDVKKIDFKNYTFAAQIVADVNFYHLNVLASKAKKEIKTNAVGPLFTVELDTDLATNPQFVKNHRTNKQEVVVQDKDNFLYLISSDGKVLWKKELNGKVQGQIHQVDIYKNGRLQLAFCTNNQFLILDRNGEEVAPFNKTFEGGNLNSLAVFDYDNNKNYRFLVTQGKKIFMYNNKGDIVDGFTYKEAENAIVKAPKHFRINKKDYLLFKLEDNTLKIRHRAGQDRIKVSNKIDFSNNEIFLYKNKFSLTDKKGILHQIDTKGKLVTTNFNLNQDHGMYATSKTLVLMNDNILSIKGKKVELELGVYTAPKIFYIYDKIYVSVTDIQNQKIYLYDSQAKPISNFPVYGSSLIDMVDIDGDKKLELVAKDQENSIIVYKIN
ncbi:ribonuclease HII [uncultured Croceitalea sp.]|uniref:ribonuclease HII n=1 Tax=uncultured Croceitalea sp. TaxID=1798908 RepID=UPI003305B702